MSTRSDNRKIYNLIKKEPLFFDTYNIDQSKIDKYSKNTIGKRKKVKKIGKRKVLISYCYDQRYYKWVNSINNNKPIILIIKNQLHNYYWMHNLDAFENFLYSIKNNGFLQALKLNSKKLHIIPISH